MPDHTGVLLVVPNTPAPSYPAYVRQDGAGSEVVFPDWPELKIICGSEQELADALEQAPEALKRAINRRRKNGLLFPYPSRMPDGLQTIQVKSPALRTSSITVDASALPAPDEEATDEAGEEAILWGL